MSTYGTNPPGYGFTSETRDCTVIVRGGNISAGRIYPFCLAQADEITADGVTLSTTPGTEGHPYSNISATIDTIDRRNGVFCVALEDALDGAQARVRLQGLVRAFVADTTNSTTSITYGKELVPGSTPFLEASAVQYTGGGNTVRKAIARALEVNSTAPTSDGSTILVDFNGLDGIGFGNVA